MHFAAMFEHVNWLAVIAATLAAFALGAIWYSKALFGNAWMQEVGLTEEAVGSGNMAQIFGGTLLLQVLATTALAALIGDARSLLGGLETGLVVGLLWISTAYGVTYLFEQRSLRLWLINAGYYVAWLAIAGAILGAWP